MDATGGGRPAGMVPPPAYGRRSWLRVALLVALAMLSACAFQASGLEHRVKIGVGKPFVQAVLESFEMRVDQITLQAPHHWPGVRPRPTSSAA